MMLAGGPDGKYSWEYRKGRRDVTKEEKD